jgi:hypothetical protein
VNFRAGKGFVPDLGESHIIIGIREPGKQCNRKNRLKAINRESADILTASERSYKNV